jgi:hypothetical protein
MAFPTGATYPSTGIYPSSGRMGINMFLFDGDSVTLGTAAGGIPNSYPVILSSGSNYSGRAEFRNIAVGGRPASQMYSEFYNSKQHRGSYNNSYLFIWGGTVIAASATGDLRDYWITGRADGWKIVAFTVAQTSGWSQANLALWTGLNNFIIANSGYYDYLVRPDLIAPNPSDPEIFSDPTHFTVSGYGKIADFINTGINLPI